MALVKILGQIVNILSQIIGQLFLHTFFFESYVFLLSFLYITSVEGV